MIGKKLNKKGITLIELLTVVVLIGIMAALAVPNFDNYVTKIKHKSTVRDILRQMRMARSYAISRAGRYGVKINVYPTKYYILFRDMDNDANYTGSPPDTMIDSTALSANLSFGSCSFISGTVVFRGDGSASETGFVDVVDDKNSNITIINVTAAVGRVYLSTP